jgi:hypothetical protein
MFTEKIPVGLTAAAIALYSESRPLRSFYEAPRNEMCKENDMKQTVLFLAITLLAGCAGMGMDMSGASGTYGTSNSGSGSHYDSAFHDSDN